ncbi:hypothetical protein BCU26_024445, partial [Vibrio splendidus]|uniref:hypothetical protein n=1 Tax=Vibrio splendidus TaxID=29497 RepID=UPI0039A5E649
WYSAVNNYSEPSKIIIVDSNSPIKPSLNKTDSRIEFISLNNNAGHSTNLKHGTKFCGWSASVLLSLQYAELCDTDYYVYIEQDVLISGKGIIESIIDEMEMKNEKYKFGSPGGTPQPLQQSFFIIKRDYIGCFLKKIHSIRYADDIIGPEYKFAIAVNHLSILIPKFLFLNKYFRYLYRKIININFINIGYGRDRPINFEDKHYYFQHATIEELNEYDKYKPQ